MKLCLHLDDSLLNVDKKFDQTKLELVARLGADWYCKVSRENLFIVPKPNVLSGIGIDALPPNIRNSKVLTGNHLGKLANMQKMPDIDPAFNNQYLAGISSDSIVDRENQLHFFAAKLLDENKVDEAWQVLLS